MINKKILYWSGFSCRKDELVYLKTEFENKDYVITKFPYNYDYGNFIPIKWIPLLDWDFDWWIGLSLGASVMVYSLSFFPKECLPKRITMINPFYSRSELAKENNFNIANQMDFQLNKVIKNIEKVELVSSIEDKKIKMNHGIKVIKNFESSKKCIIFVTSNHGINDSCVQKELAHLLMSEDYNETKYKYCDIYFK